MALHDLSATEGSRNHKAKRKGRGRSSGMGKTSGRGQKGQNARKSGGTRLGFEGGQTPLYRRLPKRGFTNFTRINYAVVSVEKLDNFNGDVVTIEALKEQKILKSKYNKLKIVGNLEVTKPLTVKAVKVTKGATAAIEAAGGKVELI